MIKIAETLKLLRKDGGLTQKELAEQLNIGQATIAGYENGQREPHIVSLIAYADFFGCSLDYIVGRCDELGSPLQSAPPLTVEQRESFIIKYRSLSKAQKAKIEGYLDGLLEKD